MNTVQYPLTIYYDASCPLCTREVSILKRYDHADQLQLVDCSPGDFATVDGHTRSAMMRLIHARDAAGQWLIGAPVFAAAYRASGFASIASLWGSRRLQRFWGVVYPWIASNRMALSRLGVTAALTWVLHRLHARAAERALAQSRGCHDGLCELPELLALPTLPELPAQPARSKVYYNSACPVCDAGIRAQQSRMSKAAIDWIDVHRNPDAVTALGKGLEEVRERLHVTDSAGRTWVGADALSQLMLATPGQKLLGRVGRWPVVRTLARVGYNGFARLLYRWNRRRGHW